MLDHLIFNKQKYYPIDSNARTVSIGGRTYYTFPKKLKVIIDNAIESDNSAINGGVCLDKGTVLDNVVVQTPTAYGVADSRDIHFIAKENVEAIW